MNDPSQASETNLAAARRADPASGRSPVGGLLFSLGYGITHRVVTLQANPEPPSQRALAGLDFPGESLASLRRSKGATGDLAVDVAAIEAKEALERQAKAKAEEQARRQLELSRKKELALQAPLPEPSWTAPDWTQPEPLWPQEPQPVPAALIEPLVDPSLDPFNPRDPLLEATAPEATVDQSDFFVPVEPNPAPAP